VRTAPASPRDYGSGMANEHGPLPPRVRLTAGTAFKAGFFGAFGVVAFWLLLSLVVVVVALVLAALGVLPGVAQLFQAVTSP
jgi:hypothetical protein